MLLSFFFRYLGCFFRILISASCEYFRGCSLFPTFLGGNDLAQLGHPGDICLPLSFFLLSSLSFSDVLAASSSGNGRSSQSCLVLLALLHDLFSRGCLGAE